MVKIAKKFAVPLNVSVSKEIFDRAHKIQQGWDSICLTKFDKRFTMSNLGELVWKIGLGILEELDSLDIADTLATERVSSEIIQVEVKKVKRALKSTTFSSLTDDEIESIIKDKSTVTDE